MLTGASKPQTKFASLGEAWTEAAPRLGLLLAESALQAVKHGVLVMVSTDSRLVIMTAEEAAARQDPVLSTQSCRPVPSGPGRDGLGREAGQGEASGAPDA